jgi:hypothetical protein
VRGGSLSSDFFLALFDGPSVLLEKVVKRFVRQLLDRQPTFTGKLIQSGEIFRSKFDDFARITAAIRVPLFDGYYRLS